MDEITYEKPLDAVANADQFYFHIFRHPLGTVESINLN